MGEIIATMIGGPAAGQAVAAHKNQPTPEAPPLTPADNLLPPLGSGAEAQQVQLPQVQAPQGGGGFGDMLLPQPEAPDESAPQPEAPPEPFNNPHTAVDDPQEIVVEGDTWQPKKQDPLAIIGDFLLMRRGMQPIFRQRLDERNKKEAMEGFQRDPDRAISRMRKVDSKTAWQMEGQRQINAANQALEVKRKADTMSRTGGVIGNMLGVIESSNNPVEAYRNLRPALETYARHGGYPEEMLPQEWDAEKVGALRKSGLSVFQQETLDRMERSLDATIKHRDAQRADLREHRGAVRAEQARTNDSLIANRRSEMDVREAREARLSVGKGREQFIFSKDRGGVVGTMSPDGRRAKIKGTNETHLFVLEKPGDINSRRYVGKEVMGDDGKPKIIYGTEQ